MNKEDILATVIAAVLVFCTLLPAIFLFDLRSNPESRKETIKECINQERSPTIKLDRASGEWYLVRCD
jgi:hypothetical protein